MIPQFSNDNDHEEFINPLMLIYPDYYHLMGKDIRSLSSSEKDGIIRILKAEFNLDFIFSFPFPLLITIWLRMYVRSYFIN